MPSNKNNTRGIGDSRKEQPAKGKSYFFGIGINVYQDKHFHSLRNAVKDVEDLAALLQARYEVDEVILVVDEEATRQNIIIQLDQLEELIGPSDKLIIYYSGHGHLNAKTGKGFWIPTDSGQAHTHQYIRNSTIRDYIHSIKSKHTLLVADSCFSGSLFARGASRASTAINKLESATSRWALCSGRSDELVEDGPAGGNSPFAGSLLGILRENDLPKLNIGKIIDQVMELTSANADQVPEANPLKDVGHRGGQYVFVLREDEEVLWEMAQQGNRIQSLMNYLEQFPSGKYRKAAIQLIAELERADIETWKAKSTQESLAGLLTYLAEFPFGTFVTEAHKRIAMLKANRLNTSTDISKKESIEIVPSPVSINGSVLDPRDGQKYKTIVLNGQIWLAENLNFEMEDSWQYMDNPNNGDKYGSLYTWQAAKQACLPGWRLPTDNDWKALGKTYGGYFDGTNSKIIGDPRKAYKALTQGGSSHFNALLGGWHNAAGRYGDLGSSGSYWSSTEKDMETAWSYYFNYDELSRSNYPKSYGLSCRCIKD